LERVALDAGFENITWLPMQIDPVGIIELGERFWEPYRQHPAIIAMYCNKPTSASNNNNHDEDDDDDASPVNDKDIDSSSKDEL
jgi:hypothetical protein